MIESVLISIRPQWCNLIANGKKTIEVRKSKPWLKTPFKCYIYMTKNYDTLFCNKPKKFCTDGGYVVGEFVCDYILEFVYNGREFLIKDDISTTVNAIKQSGLTDAEFRTYAKESNVYGWHISNLVIYDKPRVLNEFRQCHRCPFGDYRNCIQHDYSCSGEYKLTRPPQSWCYVYEF